MASIAMLKAWHEAVNDSLTGWRPRESRREGLDWRCQQRSAGETTGEVVIAHEDSTATKLAR
jgi:hypothetical protein